MFHIFFILLFLLGGVVGVALGLFLCYLFEAVWMPLIDRLFKE